MRRCANARMWEYRHVTVREWRNVRKERRKVLRGCKSHEKKLIRGKKIKTENREYH